MEDLTNLGNIPTDPNSTHNIENSPNILNSNLNQNKLNHTITESKSISENSKDNKSTSADSKEELNGIESVSKKGIKKKSNGAQFNEIVSEFTEFKEMNTPNHNEITYNCSPEKKQKVDNDLICKDTEKPSFYIEIPRIKNKYLYMLCDEDEMDELIQETNEKKAKIIRQLGSVSDGTVLSEKECISKLELQVKSDRVCTGLDLNDFKFFDQDGGVANLLKCVNTQILFQGTVLGKHAEYTVKDITSKKLFIHQVTPNSMKIEVYMQSHINLSIYYQLFQPHMTFSKFYTDFYWYCRLVVAVILWVKNNQKVVFDDLRFKFQLWLDKNYKGDVYYNAWKKSISTGGDYRHFLPNAQQLLFNQANMFYPTLLKLPFFNNEYLQSPTLRYGGELTLVTPTVYKWFYHLFADQMTVDNSNTAIDLLKNKQLPHKEANTPYLDFKNVKVKGKVGNKIISISMKSGELKIGDFVEIKIDDSTTWNDKGSEWIARIISFGYDEDGEIGFKLVWMYKIHQTVIRDLIEYTNSEIFYTSHCECPSGWYPLGVIKYKVNVNLGSDSSRNLFGHYFCRYFYDPVDMAFIKIGDCRITGFNGDLVCDCNKKEINQTIKEVLMSDLNQIGRTFILNFKPTMNEGFKKDKYKLLKIGQLIEMDFLTKKYIFRLFAIAKELEDSYEPDSNASAPVFNFHLNELILLDKKIECDINDIVSVCHVEYMEYDDEKTHLPKNLVHRGAGNHYFFRYILDTEKSVLKAPKEHSFYKALFPSRTQILNNRKDHKPLKVFDLFSGSGSLGLGITDSGLAESKWVIDFEKSATDAYKLNARDQSIKYYTQSINISFKNVLHSHQNYPRKNEVDFIIAGTPCQGYSLLNRHKEKHGSLLKSSMITSLASFVDHYRPKFVLLEQISNFVRFRLDMETEKKQREKSPFNALIAFFLSIGYQVRFKVLSASNHGTCQNRNRVFIWCAAYDQQLPSLPFPAHIGLKPNTFTIPTPDNDRAEIHQSPDKAPLPPITVRDMIGDLPPILDGKLRANGIIHHHCALLSEIHQNNVDCLPADPNEAHLGHIISKAKISNNMELIPSRFRGGKLQHEIPRTYKRIDPDGQVDTINTVMTITNTFDSIHFAEPRLLSVRECGRMQGFLDSDQFAGTIPEQYKLIGNAVPRPLGFALGLCLEKQPNVNSIELKIPTINYKVSSKQDDIPLTDPLLEDGEQIMCKIESTNRTFFIPLIVPVNLSQLIEYLDTEYGIPKVTNEYKLVYDHKYNPKKWLIYDDLTLSRALDEVALIARLGHQDAKLACIRILSCIDVTPNLTNALL